MKRHLRESRHLPWGKHVTDDTTAWKEHTYPNEPKEMAFSSWLKGFIKKECGGTVEECRTAVNIVKKMYEHCEGSCTDCSYHNPNHDKCMNDLLK